QSWVASHGVESGATIAVPAIIENAVSGIGPYFGNSRVDSALCHPQRIEAAIINKSPVQESVSDSWFLPNSTIADAPVIDRMIPNITPELKCSFFIATPIKNAKTGVSAISSAALPAFVRSSPSTKTNG